MLCLQPWGTRNGLRLRASGLAPRRARQIVMPARLPRARVALLWRRLRRFGQPVDAPRAQAVTLQFGLHLNLMLNKTGGTRSVSERIAGGLPTASARDVSAADPGMDRETAIRLTLWRDYLLGRAAPATTPREFASSRIRLDASPRVQALTLQFSSRLSVLLNTATEARQILQRIAGVLPRGARAASAFAFSPRPRDHAMTRLNSWRDVLLSAAAAEGKPRRPAMAARYRVIKRDPSLPAIALALPAARWLGAAVAHARNFDRARPRHALPASPRTSQPHEPAMVRPRAEQASSWPMAFRVGRRSASEMPRRLFRQPAVALIAHGRRTADQFHHETIDAQSRASITLAWRRAPNGAPPHDVSIAPSSRMAARTTAQAIMPAATLRDMPAALNARGPRQAGAQFDPAIMNRLTHELIGRIEQKMRIERERRGH